MMKAYGLKKCSTTSDAVKYIQSKNVDVELIDYSVTPLSKAQVSGWIKALGGWEKMINRAGYTWRGLDPSETADLTDAKAAALAIKHTSLIRRPLLEHDNGTITAGFPPKVKALF
jgi:arsenate reductase